METTANYDPSDQAVREYRLRERIDELERRLERPYLPSKHQSFWIQTPDDSAGTLYRASYPIKFCKSILLESGISLCGSPAPTERDYYHDAYLFRGIPHPEFMETLRVLKRRAKVGLNVDDDLLNIPDWNPISADVDWKVKELFNEALDLVDFVVVSTQRLKDALKRRDKTLVCPNLVNMYDFQRRAVDIKPNRVVWAGSMCHWGDLEEIGHLPAKYPKQSFWFYGDLPDAVVEFRKMRYEKTCVWGLALDNVSFIGGQVMDKFLAEIRNTPANWALAPLADEIFNDSKSALKWMEFAALGVSVMAQNQPPYCDVIEHGVTGYLIDDWAEVDWNLPSTADAAFEEVKAKHSWQCESGLQVWCENLASVLI